MSGNSNKGKEIELNKEKKRCDVCRSVDLQHFMRTCPKCNTRIAHTWCARLSFSPEPDTRDWVCNKCRATSDKPDTSAGRQTPLVRRSPRVNMPENSDKPDNSDGQQTPLVRQSPRLNMPENSDKPDNSDGQQTPLLRRSPRLNMAENSDKPLLNLDTKGADLKEKKPCGVCGSVEMDQSIMTCSKCKETRKHIYCCKENLKSVPPNWICEQCSLRRSTRDRLPNLKYID